MDTTIDNISTPILEWFDKNGRKNLPWQISKNHYRVWVSEIMLQQTQVSTAIPYFKKFISKLPTIESLANADLDEVLLLWAGLGYYARARNLHKAAKIVQTEFHGVFPPTLEGALKLPGLGRSTASAILSIVDDQPLPILDGNVKRVLTRLFAINTPVQDTKTIKMLWRYAETTTPTKRNADYTQAIMDLGATLCTRKNPRCLECPVEKNCLARKQNQTDRYPVSIRKLKRSTQETDCLVILYDEHILLTRRANSGIWGGLYTPVISNEPDSLIIESSLKSKKVLPVRKHVFTHIDLLYRPIICEARSKTELQGYQWHRLDSINKLALPKPIKTLLDELWNERLPN